MFNKARSLTFGLHILWGKSKSNHRFSQSARAKSTIHLCGTQCHVLTPRRRWKGFSELATITKPVGILNLKLFYILMQI